MGTAADPRRRVTGAAAAVAAVAATVLLAGCVRISSADPPDPSAADEAVVNAQELVEARTMAFRSVVLAEDVGPAWRVERDGDERAGVDPRAVDHVVTSCADGPDEAVLVDSPTFVRTTANVDSLVATQDGARALAAVYRGEAAAGDAFRALAADGWAACATDGLREAGDGNVVEMAAGPVPGLRVDRATAGTRFSAVFEVDGAPVRVYLDVIVLLKERVVTILELSAVNRPFEKPVRDHVIRSVRERMATTPPPG